MKVNKDQAKEILKKLPPEELALYKQLNAELGGVSEAGTRSVLKTILGNWKNYSTAMLMAIMMNSNMANAINRYSPDTYNAINTEILKDTDKGTPGQAVDNTVEVKEFKIKWYVNKQEYDSIYIEIYGDKTLISKKKWSYTRLIELHQTIDNYTGKLKIYADKNGLEDENGVRYVLSAD